VNGRDVHSTLREMQGHLFDPRVLGAAAVVAAILGFSGPFGTYDLLALVPRLLYWTAIVALTYATGYLVTMLAGPPIASRIAWPALRVAAVGLCIGPPVTAIVIAINVATFGAGGAIGWLPLLAYSTLVAIGVTAIAEIIGERAPAGSAAAEAAPGPPPILERLPHPQRGPLVAISVADHYVEVTTTRGRAMVLMRFSDALREVGDTKGVQLHRSHWVALEAVARVVRAEGRVLVELRDGRRLPVSRGFLPAVKAAGLVV